MYLDFSDSHNLRLRKEARLTCATELSVCSDAEVVKLQTFIGRRETRGALPQRGEVRLYDNLEQRLQYGRHSYSSPQVRHGINLDQALGSQLLHLDR